MSYIFRILRIAFGNLSSNKQVFMVTLVIFTVAFSLLNLFFLIFVNLDNVLATWNRQVQLIVYLDDGISKKDQKLLEELISGNIDIESSEYVSREMAWEKFKKTFSRKAEIIESIEFNPLPSSLVLQFRATSNRLDKIESFVKILRDQNGVESMEYGEKWLSRFEAFLAFVRGFLLVIGGLLCLGLILIVANTIKLSIYSRRDEVELMLMFGARPQFIKAPYVLEGVLQAGGGGLFSIGVVKLIFFYMEYQYTGMLDFVLTGIQLEFFSALGVASILIVSMSIGFLGSWISINHFMHSEINP